MNPSVQEGGFATVIGQEGNIQRLKEFRALYGSGFAEHILIVGQDGTGKRTLAQAFAGEYNLPFQSTDAPEFRNKIDLAAILANMEEGQVLFVDNIHRLREGLKERLLPALKDSFIDYVVGQGPASRTIKLQIPPITFIATAPKETDVPRDLLSVFPLVLKMQNYSTSESERLVVSFGAAQGFTLPEIITRSIARASDGWPSRMEQLVRQLGRIGKGEITEEGAIAALRVLGVNSVVADGAPPSVLAKMSGTQFEQVVTQLLFRMGFRAEMTKASGDGGVDIVAVLEKAVFGGRYLIQCKRYAPNSLVGAPLVREFYGALTADRKAVKGILITTSNFTTQAVEFAEGLPVELIDGNKLIGLFQEYDMPITP